MRYNARSSIAGFTLLELLVVILLIGIIASFAVLSIGGNQRGEELKREAKRLVALVEYAQEQSVLRTQEWGLYFEEDRYSFMILNNESWVMVDEGHVLRERKLPQGIALEVQVEDLDVSLAPDFSLEESEDEEGLPRKKPMIFILSSGELTPFSVLFSAPDSEIEYRVISSPFGELKMEF